MLEEKTVLVAEDDRSLLIFISGVLKELKCQKVITFTNGKHVIYAFKNHKILPIDLIISDWEMPGATGRYILEYVRGEESISKTPFIMTTSRNSMEDVRAVKELKIDAYLIKPYSHNDLSKRIKAIFK